MHSTKTVANLADGWMDRSMHSQFTEIHWDTWE